MLGRGFGSRTFLVTLSAVSLLALVACDDDDTTVPDAPSGPMVDAPTPHLDAGFDATWAFPDAGPLGDARELDRSACIPDESGAVPSRCGGMDAPACDTWTKVDVEGATCSDGSPYKIFVNYHESSNNLVVMFEPGGACWDYPSCSGNGGIRGAANPHGIPDNHMDEYQFLNLLRRNDDNNPVQDYNMVFIPYCTGDVHTGNKVATYPDPAGGPDLVFRHVGHDNVMKSIAWMQTQFASIPKLFVTGCSAGGIGAFQNYYYVRQGMTGAQCGYLLDDSGPAFHSNGPSKQLHETIRAAWDLDPLLDSLEGQLDVDVTALKADFGLINVAVGDKFPHDRLALTLFRQDLNYSLYSYQRFFPGSTDVDIHAFWDYDIQRLILDYQQRSNMAYFIPNFRFDNCSHCVSIPPLGHDVATELTMPWLGSAIEAANIDLKGFTTDLLDPTATLHSYLEAVNSSEVFTADQLQMCLAGG